MTDSILLCPPLFLIALLLLINGIFTTAALGRIEKEIRERTRLELERHKLEIHRLKNEGKYD